MTVGWVWVCPLPWESLRVCISVSALALVVCPGVPPPPLPPRPLPVWAHSTFSSRGWCSALWPLVQAATQRFVPSCAFLKCLLLFGCRLLMSGTLYPLPPVPQKFKVMFRLAHFYELWKANFEKVCDVYCPWPCSQSCLPCAFCFLHRSAQPMLSCVDVVRPWAAPRNIATSVKFELCTIIANG
jgi:hypothetical protein